MGETQNVALADSAGLAPYLRQLADRPAWRWSGRVVEANGQTVEAEGPLCSVGECCEIVEGDGERHRAEVIGFRGRHVLAMRDVSDRWCWCRPRIKALCGECGRRWRLRRSRSFMQHAGSTFCWCSIR